jgi:hypothetical protein
LFDQVTLLSYQDCQQLVWASAVLGNSDAGAVGTEKITHETVTNRPRSQLQRTNMLLSLGKKRSPATSVDGLDLIAGHADESAPEPTFVTTGGARSLDETQKALPWARRQ